MSYVIHLFEHPGPTTLAEAVQLHERLSATPAGRNERMLRWAQAMQARFPTGWPEGPPDGDSGGSAVLSVGLALQALEWWLPAAVSLALPLGLCVLDPQAGRCYARGGWALTQHGRVALKPAGAPAQPAAPPALAAASTAEQAVGSRPWAIRRLLQRIAPALAVHGFQASAGPNGLRFARVAPLGLQSLSLQVQEDLRVLPSADLEPLLPHALYRAVRPGRTLPCHTHRLGGLARFGATAEARPGRNPWYRLHCDANEIDALGDALAHWMVDSFLPLFDACRDLRDLLRLDDLRQQNGLPAYVGANRTMLALRHWVEGQDLEAHARKLAEECDVHIRILLTSAHALQALPTWAGAWRPLPAPCQVYGLHETVSASALGQAALPRLRRAAEDHGFKLLMEGPLALEMRRESAEVVQTLSAEAKPGPMGAQLSVSVGWEAPALTAHWRSAWPGAAQASGLGAWQTGGPPTHAWMRGPLEAAGIDSADLSATVEWPDQVADHVQAAEQALRDWLTRLLDPAMRWEGLARQLPTVDEFAALGKTHWMSSHLRQLGPAGWAALLMLTSLYRTDAPAYAQAMRTYGTYVAEVEPLLQAVERQP